MVHCVKGSFEVDESNVEVSVLPKFSDLFDEQAKGRDMVYGRSVGHETSLFTAASASGGRYCLGE